MKSSDIFPRITENTENFVNNLKVKSEVRHRKDLLRFGQWPGKCFLRARREVVMCLIMFRYSIESEVQLKLSEA